MYIVANVIMSMCFVAAVNAAWYDLDSIQADHWWYRFIHSLLITVATFFGTCCHAEFKLSLAMVMIVVLAVVLNFLMDTAYAKPQCSKKLQRVLQILLAATLVVMCCMYEQVTVH